MKKMAILLLSLFFAQVSMGDECVPDPITSFPEGRYLGAGYYGTNTGDAGDFSTYAEIYSDGWEVACYIDNGNLISSSAFFNFDDFGFFDVEIDTEQGTYYGNGYCRAVQCHYAVDLGDKILEETISFITWENRLYVVGSVRPHGDQENNFAQSWEASLAQLNW
jgi:hypothetical protein